MYKQFSTETLLLRNCLKIFMRKGHPWGMNHTLHKLSSGPLHGQLRVRKHHFKEQIRKKVQQRRKVFSPPVSDLGAGGVRKWRQAECHAERSHFLPCAPHPGMSGEPTYSSTSKSLPVLHKPVSPGEWTVSIAGCQLPFTHLHLSLNDSVQQPHREPTGRETGSEERRKAASAHKPLITGWLKNCWGDCTEQRTRLWSAETITLWDGSPRVSIMLYPSDTQQVCGSAIWITDDLWGQY